MTPTAFQQLIAEKGKQHWRDMPWRQDTRPYYVLVSELMLQQTQVPRVVPKFEQFVATFPTEQALAAAPLADVLVLWQGLGYNRRAKFLHTAAQMIVNDFSGQFPGSVAELQRLPGVGANTAGAIAAYAFNNPSIFVETNVRTVYLHHYFADAIDVQDAQIVAMLETTLDRNNPRQFYQALMDYGAWLKASGVKNIDRSKHYKKQPTFAGSLRQMRGEILRRLAAGAIDWRDDIEHDERFPRALSELVRDGLVQHTADDYRLTGAS